MNGIDHHTFGADDLHVEYHGQPSIGTMPIVMVHGGWTDGTTWRMVVPDLARDRLVVTFDRRGHSRSPWPHPVTRRQSYDPATGAVQWFVSGWDHPVVDQPRVFGGDFEFGR